MNSELTTEEVQILARRFVHDIRNHLNGVSMETMFLEEILADDEASTAVARIRKEQNLIERDLRAFSSRLATPEKDIVPAMDVFHLWQSSGRQLTSITDGTWRCELNSELVNIDMRMIANVLCELLPLKEKELLEAAAHSDQNGVSFEVRRCAASASLDRFLPGFEKIIAGNGGDFVSHFDEAKGECLYVCRFPLASQ